MDMRLDKGFKIHERYSLHLVADFFNVTNRANLWSNPDVSATITTRRTARRARRAAVRADRV